MQSELVLETRNLMVIKTGLRLVVLGIFSIFLLASEGSAQIAQNSPSPGPLSPPMIAGDPSTCADPGEPPDPLSDSWVLAAANNGSPDANCGSAPPADPPPLNPFAGIDSFQGCLDQRPFSYDTCRNCCAYLSTQAKLTCGVNRCLLMCGITTYTQKSYLPYICAHSDKKTKVESWYECYKCNSRTECNLCCEGFIGQGDKSKQKCVDVCDDVLDRRVVLSQQVYP